MQTVVSQRSVIGSLLVLQSLAALALAEARKNVQYAKVGEIPLHVDLYLPEKADGAPLIVWIHGGGWQQGSKDRCPLTWLTSEGYTVASVQYRLTDKGVVPRPDSRLQRGHPLVAGECEGVWLQRGEDRRRGHFRGRTPGRAVGNIG